MKTRLKLRFKLPDWLFKPRKISSASSSTVGEFSPEEGIKSEQGFKGRMIPGPEAVQYDRKTVLINDPSLKFEEISDALRSAHAVQHLIKQGFQVYIVKEGKPVLLKTTAELSDGDRQDAGVAADILIRETKIPADDIVVCNFEKLEELRETLYGGKSTVDRIENLILDQWLRTGSIPRGQGFPSTLLTTQFMEQIGPEGMKALASSDIKWQGYSVTKTPDYMNARLDDYYNNGGKGKSTTYCSNMPNLRSYSINKCHANNSQILSTLKSSHQIRALNLARGTNTQLMQAKIDNPKYQLPYADINNDDLAYMEALTTLESLKIDDHTIDNTLLNLKNAGEIRNLELNSCKISLACLSQILGKACHVNRLKITGCNPTFETTGESLKVPLAEVETLILDDKTTRYCSILFKDAHKVRDLRYTWVGGCNIQDLHEAKMPNVTSLDLSGSNFNADSLAAALKVSSNIEFLDISKVNLDGHSGIDLSGINLNKVKKLVLRDLSYSNLSRNPCIISTLLEKMNQIEEIDANSQDTNNTGYYFEAKCSPESFRMLKVLHLRNVNFDCNTVQQIISNAHGLKSLDLSAKSSINNDAGRKDRAQALITALRGDTTLPELEYLDLSYTMLDADDLLMILKKMPKLSSLSLVGATIQGHTNQRLDPNPLIDINVSNASIEDSTINGLVTNSAPIALSFRGCFTNENPGMSGYENILKGTNAFNNQTPELLLLNVGGDHRIGSGLYLNLFPKLRLLSAMGTTASSVWFDEDEFYPDVEYFDVRESSLNSDQIFAALKVMPNIKELMLNDHQLDAKILTLINNGPYTHKKTLLDKLTKQWNSRSTQQGVGATDSTTAQNIIRGHKEDNIVYDTESDSPDGHSLNPPSENQNYKLVPFFKHKRGTDLNCQVIRRWCYQPDFNTDPMDVTRREIPCELSDYSLPLDSSDVDSVYEQLPYEVSFQEADPKRGLTRPWIRLNSLTANDKLLSLKTSMDPSIFKLSFSEPDGFYYLTLKEGATCPKLVQLQYEISPAYPTCQALPESIKKARRPFYATYESPPGPDFVGKNLKDKLAAIIKNPEHHVCGVRSEAFLSSIVEDKNIQGYRMSGAGLHAWAEVKYNNTWYTVDNGGAPADMEFLPAKPLTTPNELHVIPVDKPDKAVIEQDRAAVIPPENPKVILDRLLNDTSPNSNILLICREDEYKHHLKSLRRHLLSLAPDTTTVVDNYENGLSSLPFIRLNSATQTWKPVEPIGADGWLAQRMNSKTHAPSRLIMDWSSFTENQSTKLNGCIDLNDRNIDGVPINTNTQVVGLICENDPRLTDSSFLSRHAGKILNVSWSPEPAPAVNAEEILPVELYHSPLWQRLLLGKLGFDDKGNAKHKSQALLNANTPKHMIINNPPEHCEAFDRFIQDLEDGRSFKYCDKNITLPRMQVSFAQGYDFTTLKPSIKTLNINITRDSLASTHIDHVLTPNTFERCLETRRIVDGKLITSPGWLYAASSEQPISVYINKTLSEQQYCFLLTTAQKQSLNLYCAPGVELPKELGEIPGRNPPPFGDVALRAAGRTDGAPLHLPFNKGGESVFDVSELTADDILYRFDYKHDKENNTFVFTEKVSDVWKKLELGEDIILTGEFSDELKDHLETLLLPQPYLWHDGQKKTFKGKLILQPNEPGLDCRGAPQIRKEPIHIKTEAERKPALLSALQEDPIVFIEGKPGIGKSCFIRELKSDESLNCYSFNPHDNTTLKAWAASNDSRPTILLIDEATELGTDFTMFKGLYNPKREILIDGEIYALKENQYVVPIGNRKQHMPALLNEHMPTLVFDTLTRDYVIDKILKPIFAEVDKESALAKAIAHYDANKSVREMQGEAILICASEMNQCRGGLTPQENNTRRGRLTPQENNTCRGGLTPQAYPPSCAAPTRDEYHLTDNRKPIFDAIIDSLHARQFMQQAQADAAKYGGQTGHMLEGLSGLGKSDIIHAAMLSARYEEVTNLNELHEAGRDHRFRYYRIPATCSIQNLRKHLKQAFEQGCIVHIDELDALLKPDTRDKEGDVARLIAELNAYLMGEDLEHLRPEKPGFMLLATGNGITYRGRASLTDSLASRLHQHKVQPYTKKDCEWIIAQKHPGLNASKFIDQFLTNPKGYTFRELLADCKRSDPQVYIPVEHDMGRPEKKYSAQSHTAAPIIYHFYNTRAFKMTMPGVLVGVSLGLSLAYTATFDSLPIIAGLSIAGTMTAAIIAACCMHVAKHCDAPTLRSVSLIALA